ncbi:hypothetical protein [Kineosporia sp. NBRC 101677]|uniref:hypothetical protein n=1 Tax=Kineosporia sp. NBRC 101677 TaxID=3032197 RepID=UPI0025539786|nr:hypothetical protein [Kineosporia sp. NBRC 101677]
MTDWDPSAVAAVLRTENRFPGGAVVGVLAVGHSQTRIWVLESERLEDAAVAARPVVLAERRLPGVGSELFDRLLLERALGRLAEIPGADETLTDRLREPAGEPWSRLRKHLIDQVRRAREELTAWHSATVEVDEIPGISPDGPLRLDRIELDNALRPHVLQMAREFGATIEESGRRPSLLDGIYLLGDGQMPLIVRSVYDVLGVSPTVGHNRVGADTRSVSGFSEPVTPHGMRRVSAPEPARPASPPQGLSLRPTPPRPKSNGKRMVVPGRTTAKPEPAPVSRPSVDPDDAELYRPGTAEASAPEGQELPTKDGDLASISQPPVAEAVGFGEDAWGTREATAAKGTPVAGATDNGTYVDGPLVNGTVVSGVVVNEAVANGTSAGETSVNGASMGGASVDEGSTDGSWGDGAPANGAPSNGIRSNGTSTSGTPADKTMADGMSVNGTAANGTSATGAWRNGTPSSTTPTSGTTANGSSASGISADATLADGTSVNGTAATGTSAHETSSSGTPVNGTATGTTANGTWQDGTPSSRTSTGGTTADETSTNGTPDNGTTAYGTTVDGARSNGTSTNGTRANGTPSNGTEASGGLTNETSAYRAPVNGTTAHGTTVNGTRGNGAPADGTLTNGTSVNGTSANGSSRNGASLSGTSPNGTPHNGASLSGTSPNGTSASLNGASVKNGTARPTLNGTHVVASTSTDSTSSGSSASPADKLSDFGPPALTDTGSLRLLRDEDDGFDENRLTGTQPQARKRRKLVVPVLGGVTVMVAASLIVVGLVRNDEPDNTASASPVSAGSDLSAASTAPSPSPTFSPTPEVVALPAVKGLKARKVGIAVALTWEEVEGADRYAVYRDPGTPDEKVRTAVTTKLTDRPGDGITHTYAVVALDEQENEGVPGPEVKAKALAPYKKVQHIASEWTAVVPQKPNRPGESGQVCVPKANKLNGSDGRIVCNYPDGLKVTLFHYDTPETTDRRHDDLAATKGVKSGLWTIERKEKAELTGRQLSGRRMGGAWRWTTYDSAPNYAVQLQWKGHSPAELAKWVKQHKLLPN